MLVYFEQESSTAIEASLGQGGLNAAAGGKPPTLGDTLSVCGMLKHQLWLSRVGRGGGADSWHGR